MTDLNRIRRAEMYAVLAEMLAEPVDWMTSPGRDWRLFTVLSEPDKESVLGCQYADLLIGIPAENLDQRRDRYDRLFASGKPRFWLNESAFDTGKILGPQTFTMAKTYRAAGLEIPGAELPDHISLELNFLSLLVEHLEDPSYEQQFLKEHGNWMIKLGRGLQGSGDPVYGRIGTLLADWIIDQTHKVTSQPKKAAGNQLYPEIINPDECSLCGFCAQVCPTHALKVMEGPEIAFLSFRPADCNNCGKCERICEFRALKMSISVPAKGEAIVLRQSPQLSCETCGGIIASQAELDHIVSRIGEATWQHYCLECRSKLQV